VTRDKDRRGNLNTLGAWICRSADPRQAAERAAAFLAQTTKAA
jgi:hypothetical protein